MSYSRCINELGLILALIKMNNEEEEEGKKKREKGPGQLPGETGYHNPRLLLGENAR